MPGQVDKSGRSGQSGCSGPLRQHGFSVRVHYVYCVHYVHSHAKPTSLTLLAPRF